MKISVSLEIVMRLFFARIAIPDTAIASLSLFAASQLDLVA